MQYIGERTVRLYEVGSYDLNKGKDRFLSDKGMLLEYLLSTDYNNEKDSISGRRNGRNYKYTELSATEKIEYFTRVMKKSEIERCESFDYNDKLYIKMNTKKCDQKNIITIYEVLPAIYNDELFNWTTNKKYNTKETTLVFGTFEFHCICDINNNIQIDVKYAKCDNRHHNRVTISTIKINDANNETILDAIDYWKEEFVNELMAM